MAIVERRIYHIGDQASAILNTQLCYETLEDVDLGYHMWCGKDIDGYITKWLAKDENARVNALTINNGESMGSAGYLMHDINGLVSGNHTPVTTISRSVPVSGALVFTGSGVSQGGTANRTFTFTNTTYAASSFLHSGLDGLPLAFADHPYYLAVDGTRELTGNWSLGGFNLSNADTITPQNVTATYALSTVYGHEYTSGAYGILTRGVSPGGLTSDILVTEDAGIDILSTLSGAASGIECRAAGLTLKDKYLYDSTSWPATGDIQFAASTAEVDLLYNTGTPGAKSLLGAIMLESLSFPGMPGDPLRGPKELWAGNGILLTRADTANAIQIDSVNNAVTYQADNIMKVSGGAVTGDVTSIRDIHEEVYYTIVEEAATPGFSFYVEFVDVESFNVLTFRAKYAYTHDVHVQLYRWSDTIWVDEYSITDVGIFVTQGVPVKSSSVFIGTDTDAGKVRVRFYHVDPGNPSHIFYLDYCALEMTSGGSALGLDVNYRADFVNDSNVINADTEPVGIVMSTDITGLAMTQLNAANTSELALIYNASTAAGGDIGFLFQGATGNGENVLGHRALWTEGSMSIGATNTLGASEINSYLNFNRWDESEQGWHQRALLQTIGGSTSQYYSFLKLDVYDDINNGASINMESTGTIDITAGSSVISLTTNFYATTTGAFFFNVADYIDIGGTGLRDIENASFKADCDVVSPSAGVATFSFAAGSPDRTTSTSADVTSCVITRPLGSGAGLTWTIFASGADVDIGNAAGWFKDATTSAVFVKWYGGEGNPDTGVITIPSGKSACISIKYTKTSSTVAANGTVHISW